MTDYKDMTFIAAVKYLPTRVINLASKLLSLRGVALYWTYFMIKEELFPIEAVPYVWGFALLVGVFGDKALTVIKDLKR